MWLQQSHNIAPFPLDFAGRQSVTVVRKETAMDRTTSEQAIKLILAEIRVRLSEATRIAKAAEACAVAGSVGEGVTLSMDIEQLVYEAGRLQDAASLLNRLSSS